METIIQIKCTDYDSMNGVCKETTIKGNENVVGLMANTNVIMDKMIEIANYNTGTGAISIANRHQFLTQDAIVMTPPIISTIFLTVLLFGFYFIKKFKKGGEVIKKIIK